MGCNCGKGGKKKSLNNLDSVQHLELAKEVYDRIISQKQFNDIDNFDWAELYSVFSQLYPQSSVVPSKEQLIVDIKNAMGLLELKYTKIKRKR